MSSLVHRKKVQLKRTFGSQVIVVSDFAQKTRRKKAYLFIFQSTLLSMYPQKMRISSLLEKIKLVLDTYFDTRFVSNYLKPILSEPG